MGDAADAVLPEDRDWDLLVYAHLERAADSAEVARALDAIDASDPEKAHGDADSLLLKAVAPEVAAAYMRVVERANWWATS